MNYSLNKIKILTCYSQIVTNDYSFVIFNF